MRAAHEAEGDDGDEAMAGDENVSMQCADRGSGIKKNKSKRRSKIEKSQKQRQDGKRPVGAREATESGTALRGVSQNRVARGLTITSTSVDLPLSLPQSPHSLFT